jgi:hypothetical protein
LASYLAYQDNFPEAEVFYRLAIRGLEVIYGAQHPTTRGYLKSLAAVLEKMGNLDEAE